MIKKILSFVLTGIMIIGIGTTTCAAEQVAANAGRLNNDDVTAYGTITSGCNDVTPFPTVEQQIAELKSRNMTSASQEAITKLLDNGTSTIVQTKATTWSHLPGQFYCYAQTESAYCMPATAQAVIRYLTGSCDSQSVVAKALGVTPTGGGDFAKMKPYLNEKQSAVTYVAKNNTVSLSTMKSNFYSDITTFEGPAVLRIAISSSEGWPYSTNGHALNVNAARDDQAYFQLADPWIQYANPSGNPFYQKAASTIYTAVTKNKYCGYLY